MSTPTIHEWTPEQHGRVSEAFITLESPILIALNVPRRARIITHRQSLTRAQVDWLMNIGTWELPPPYFLPGKEGRTLNMRPKTPWELQHEEPVKGLKLKGGGGLKVIVGTAACHPPSPDQPYAQGAIQIHPALRDDLTFHTVTSTPKANTSLRKRNAEQEFDTQNRLAECQLGFRGLLAAQCLTTSGAPEIDCNGYETGFVWSERDPDFREVADEIKFLIDGENIYAHSKILEKIPRETPEEKIPLELMKHFLSFAKKMGEAKRRAATEARVARHSGDTSNYLTDGSRVILTDTDSCIWHPDDRRARGAQLLRDTACDLLKVVTHFTHLAYSPIMFAYLDECNPIEAFLEGFFGDTVSRNVIREKAAQARMILLAHLASKKEKFEALATRRKNLLDGRENGQLLISQWHTELTPFLEDCFNLIFEVMKQSTLQDDFLLDERVTLAEFKDRSTRYIWEDFLPRHL